MDQLEFIIDNERPNLASEDKVALRETISRIEARILSNFKEPSEQVAEGSSNRNLLLQLIKVGLELQNTDLLLILVARLKLGQVALILQSFLQLSNEKGKPFALSHVAEHFHIDQAPIKQQLLSLDYGNCDTIFDLKFLVKLFIESNEWKKASEFRPKDSDHEHPLNRLISLELAQHYEAMENFYEALINYETSDTQLKNSVRVIIKLYLGSSRVKLREYCLHTDESLKDFWDEFSLFCSVSSSRGEKESLGDDRYTYCLRTRPRSGLLKTNPESGDQNNIDALPERMKKLINESNDSKIWLIRRTIEGIVSSATSLDLDSRRRLSAQASQYWQSNCIPKACASFLCLDESLVASQLSSRFLAHSEASKLNLLLGLPEASAVNLLRSLRSQSGKSNTDQINALRRDSTREHSQASVFFSALNLGLLDEALKCYCDVFAIDEDASEQILDNLENLVAARHSGALDRVDPTIRAATLSILRQILASERIPIAPVISIIIYCMAIYVYKLDNHSHFVSIPIRVIRMLEVMFEHTSDCMKGCNFNATNSLVRSTSILVTAIKDKLEIVSDSEIIRFGVKNLVESVASRCLVESQFKQAATLYSQIEDHASAIKSLMRLGDIDTVMNYSLLVRDITVDRLTINYLRHLDVDSGTIEEFITKSKQ